MYLIDDDDLLEKYNILFGINSLLILKKNLIANLSLIKKFLKTNIKFMVMKLQIFTIKEFLR